MGKQQKKRMERFRPQEGMKNFRVLFCLSVTFDIINCYHRYEAAGSFRISGQNAHRSIPRSSNLNQFQPVRVQLDQSQSIREEKRWELQPRFVLRAVVPWEHSLNFRLESRRNLNWPRVSNPIWSLPSFNVHIISTLSKSCALRCFLSIFFALYKNWPTVLGVFYLHMLNVQVETGSKIINTLLTCVSKSWNFWQNQKK